MEVSFSQIESTGRSFMQSSLELGRSALYFATLLPRTILEFKDSGKQGPALDSDFKARKIEEGVSINIKINGDGIYVPPVFSDAFNLYDRTNNFYTTSPDAVGTLPEIPQIAS